MSAKPTPIAALLASRKTVLYAFAAILVLIMCTGLEVAIVVGTIRGKLAFAEAIGLSFGPLATGAIGVLGLAAKLIGAIAQEDAAAKASPQSIAAGGDVVVQKNDES